MGNCHTFKNWPYLQFIVIEYQSLQNVNKPCKDICLQTVASVYIDSTKIQCKLFISPGTALFVQPSRAVFCQNGLSHENIMARDASKVTLFDVLGWSTHP